MNIKDTVNQICKKYKTQNPYELADCLSININYCELGTIRGFFVQRNRIKQIFINHNLPEQIRKFVLSHEIGHAIMHPNRNTLFLQNTFFSTDRLEIEANKFAIQIVMPDEDIMEHWEYTIDEWAMFYGLPREIIELRFDKR